MVRQKAFRGKDAGRVYGAGHGFQPVFIPGSHENLDELIEHDAGFDRNDFFTTALDAGKYDGHQCALPYETVPVLLFVNKSLLAKEQIEVPGEDWTWTICMKSAVR